MSIFPAPLVIRVRLPTLPDSVKLPLLFTVNEACRTNMSARVMSALPFDTKMPSKALMLLSFISPAPLFTIERRRALVSLAYILPAPLFTILKKCAHISIDCDWTEAQVKEVAEKIKNAL